MHGRVGSALDCRTRCRRRGHCPAERCRQRRHRLLYGIIWPRPVGVEDVDMVQAESSQALVDRRQQMLPRGADSVRAWPHLVAGLRRDDELVAMSAEVFTKDAPEVRLGAAVRGSVHVCRVEVSDAAIEGPAKNRTARVERTTVAEVLPSAQRDRWKLQSAYTATPIHRRVITRGCRHIGHGD